MKKSMKEKLPLIAAVLLFLTAVVCMFFMTKEEPDSEDRLILQVISIVCMALSLVCVVSRDSGKKLKELINTIKEFVEEFVGKIVAKIAEFLGLTGGRGYGNKRFLQDYKDVSIKIGKPQSKKKRFEKKYKDMDNRERIRFFYSKMMNRQIRKGYKFKPSRTASEHGEILLKYEKISQEGEFLFDSYNVARYDSGGIITEENVENVKKICKKH